MTCILFAQSSDLSPLPVRAGHYYLYPEAGPREDTSTWRQESSTAHGRPARSGPADSAGRRTQTHEEIEPVDVRRRSDLSGLLYFRPRSPRRRLRAPARSWVATRRKWPRPDGSCVWGPAVARPLPSPSGSGRRSVTVIDGQQPPAQHKPRPRRRPGVHHHGGELFGRARRRHVFSCHLGLAIALQPEPGLPNLRGHMCRMKMW